MFCTNCGAPNNDTDNFCARCGHALNRADPASSGTDAQAPGAAVSGTSVVYAGFWRRVAAYLVDWLVLTFAMLAAGFVLGIGMAIAGASDALMDVASVLLGVVSAWLYYALLQSGPRQATLGKQALGIQVTDLQGHRISFARATGRYFATILSSLTLGIGYVMAAFTARRQTLHDMVAGTVVVHAGTQAGAVGTLPVDPKPISAGAIAAIVLAAMVPLAGIMAAIAIPAYQDYTVRAQVHEGLALAADTKAAIAEAWAGGHDWDSIDSRLLGLHTGTGSKYVRSIEVYSGAIEIVYGKAANAHIQDRTLVLVPALDADDDLVWLCGYEQPAEGVEPLFASHWDLTDVEPKYLPAQCRPGSVATERL